MKCPHCKEKISKVIISELPEMGLSDSNTSSDIPGDRYVVATCPSCETIISVLLNPDRKGQSLEGIQVP